MPTVEMVTKVWIAPGCIVCDACETTAPTVFEVKHEDGTCLIRPDALNAEFTKPLTKDIILAAEECPVDVIKFDLVPVEVSEEQFKSMSAAAPAGGAAAEATPAGAKAGGEKHAAPVKPAAPPKPKVLDPAIQALLAATTLRGGHVVIKKGEKDLPDTVKNLAKQSPEKLPADARYQKVIDKTKDVKEEPTRRDVMLGIGWTATALAFGAVPVAAFNRFMAPNVLEEEDPKVRCGSLAKYSAMAPGDVNEDFKQVKPSGFWLIREEERIVALSIICTHLGCIPSWLPNDRKFKCPCHGSGFKPDGKNFEGPAPRPLERFKVYLDGDEVIVDRSRKFLAMGPSDTAVWSDPEASIPV